MEALTTNHKPPTTTPPLVVIVGPTASGKSALGMLLAKKFEGEIICADSRTVYKGLDIGTAKPSKQDQGEVRHHLLDVVNLDQPFTASDFKRLALKAINDINERNKLPIMVGGSGLYIDAVLHDYQFAAENAPRDKTNPRLLDESVTVTKKPLRDNTLILGVKSDRGELKTRITKRVNAMVQYGLLDEVETAIKINPSSKALLAPGYKAFGIYLSGELSLEQAKDVFVKNDLKLAKRQMTWFKRNKSIQWISSRDEAITHVSTFLDNAHYN